MSTNTGGPAFPVPLHQGEAYNGHGPADGMTLRDYFAAKALQGICAHHDTWGIATETTVAQQAYAVADAMLAARGAA